MISEQLKKLRRLLGGAAAPAAAKPTQKVELPPEYKLRPESAPESTHELTRIFRKGGR